MRCCGYGLVLIRFILVGRILVAIWVAKNLPKSWKISTKINQNHKNIIHFFSKILNLCLTEINIYHINNKTDHFLEKYIFIRKISNNKNWYILDIRSVGPDPYQNNTDPQHCKYPCLGWMFDLPVLPSSPDWRSSAHKRPDNCFPNIIRGRRYSHGRSFLSSRREVVLSRGI